MPEAEKKTSKKQPLDHLRSLKQPVTRTVRILTDSDIGEEYARLEKQERALERRLTASESSGNPNPVLIAEHKTVDDKLEALRKDVEDNSILFKFRSIGRKKFDRIQEQHTPTAEQQIEFDENKGDDPALANAKMPFNSDTYPRALIAACIIEPEVTENDCLEWLDDDTWNEAEIEALFTAAMEANTQRRVLDLGKG